MPSLAGSISREGSGPIQPGHRFLISRAFEPSEVEAFAKLTGDGGDHHVQTDESGRLVVHGLLTGSLPTILGGALDFLIRTMTYEFHAPVYTGETITCALEMERVEPHRRGAKVQAKIVCTNPAGELVLSGHCAGLAKTPDPVL